MNDYFRSQLTIYAGYHRDERNRVTRMFGIPMILLAIVLPLSLWPVTVFGIPANAAMLLAIPALSGWILLDVAIGLVILNYPTSIDLCSDREPCQLYWRLAYRRRFIRYRLGLADCRARAVRAPQASASG